MGASYGGRVAFLGLFRGGGGRPTLAPPVPTYDLLRTKNLIDEFYIFVSTKIKDLPIFQALFLVYSRWPRSPSSAGGSSAPCWTPRSTGRTSPSPPSGTLQPRPYAAPNGRHTQPHRRGLGRCRTHRPNRKEIGLRPTDGRQPRSTNEKQ